MSAIASLTMPHRLPSGCVEDRDRHGNIRIYYRAKGRPKARLRGAPWTPEFMAEYDAAKDAEISVARHAPRSPALGVGFVSVTSRNVRTTGA
jgi:hypothetical protein